MRVVKYINCDNILIAFQNPYPCTVKTTYRYFSSGGVKNPMFPNTYGAGYLGIGDYVATNTNGRFTPEYNSWRGMLDRLHGTSKNNRCYHDCKISPDFYNFQLFAEWYKDNAFDCGNEKLDVDKDILIKNNKAYSSATCILVPSRINKMFIKRSNQISKYPPGVYLMKNGKYQGRIWFDGKVVRSDFFSNINDAFKFYKHNKERIIKNMADEYLSKYPKFPKKIYNALYSYTVDFND